jgi:hypothetical protein
MGSVDVPDKVLVTGDEAAEEHWSLEEAAAGIWMLLRVG